MRFLPTEEQRDFARSLDAMLTTADTPTAVRAWATGDPAPGRALWSRLAEAGVFALSVPERYEGVGPLPVELATAFVELGRHAVPGPLVETAATGALLSDLSRRGEETLAKRLLPGVAAGTTMPTLAVATDPIVGDRPAEAARVVGNRSAGRWGSPRTESGGGWAQPDNGAAPVVAPGTGSLRPARAPSEPSALDADVADLVLVVRGDELRLAAGHEGVRPSADPARRLARPTPGGEVLARGPAVVAAAAYAQQWAMLATAAQALGVGLALLDRTVAYAKQRTQFGAPIGSFQAVKHRLADTLIALEFARPLLFGAAVTFESTDLAAAKVAAGEAAYAAARTALQIHGAIGYTEELDLSLWLRKARPLRDAWGTPSWCREQVVSTYTGGS
ncbi:acyl-CoA dehydrogenase family protein [Streptomyces sp. P9(2023)]|uniref:acyl-CoA dehydrogenase family protein n=1 Tax=Streptomyces sp. P9(2023) TaxID=3064394 RepID=UPI0028F460D5|nr:acyl-CoA dehydrogenase family protein [Streptomyces sp. P9(2023)]MDT9687853.1 acyl-CoA dehydrogenase family protein [Streptomyces sp. P9(2023)]